MSFLSAENRHVAAEIVARYPRPRSAMLPLLHLAQQQHGHVTDDAMREVAELCEVTPAEVKGTATFYEMFKFGPVGKYLVNVCTNISCQLLGGEELLAHAEATLGVKAGGTTADGMFTLEEVECIAACTEAPCLQVNYRYRHRVDSDSFDALIGELRAGQLDDVPDHGTLARVRQQIPHTAGSMIVAPEAAAEAPVWMSTMAADATGPDGAETESAGDVQPAGARAAGKRKEKGAGVPAPDVQGESRNGAGSKKGES